MKRILMIVGLAVLGVVLLASVLGIGMLVVEGPVR